MSKQKKNCATNHLFIRINRVLRNPIQQDYLTKLYARLENFYLKKYINFFLENMKI